MSTIDKRNSGSGENNRESQKRFNSKDEYQETGADDGQSQRSDQRPFRNYRVTHPDTRPESRSESRGTGNHEFEQRSNRVYNAERSRNGYDRPVKQRFEHNRPRRERSDRQDGEERHTRNEYGSATRNDQKAYHDKISQNESEYVNGEQTQDQTQEIVNLGTNTRAFIELPESINDFDDMKFLSEHLFMGIHNYGFKTPSQIQAKTIHIINNGSDLIAQSQSGTGKTGAFAIGSLSRVDLQAIYPQVLIVANTRLLALQIHKVVENIAKFMGIEVVACVGGHKSNSQMNAQQVKYAHVLVGTPGRICEMLTKRAFDGKKVKTLIMDESDVLLKDDFRPQIIEIISKLSEKTQICIFSATFTKETLLLTEKFLRDPYRVTVEKEEVSVKEIKQYKVDVGYERNKFATLKDLFSRLSFNQMIIFVRSIKSAEELRNKLMDQNIQAGLVHGKMNSIDRENVLKEFRLAYIKILISTDVMCRGIDIDDLRIVINYDMPEDEETYIHRVGRSGRYGGQGIAVNFCTFDDSHKIRILIREYNLDIQDMPDPEEVNLSLTGMAPPVGKVSSAKNYS